MIDAELLHAAADVVATQKGPEDAGMREEEINKFLDESTFLREVTGNEIGIHRGLMAYGIAIGIYAAMVEFDV